jgi:hypothetical protein
MSDAIRQWVADQTGLTTIWMHPNAPRPVRPYCTLQITDVALVGEPVYRKVGANGERQVWLDREATVSVQVYESTDTADPRAALERAEDLRDSLELVTVRQDLADAGWAVRGYELLSDVPQLLDSQWEPRAVFDVRFGTTKELIEDVGLIESIEITGSVRDTDFENTQISEV